MFGIGVRKGGKCYFLDIGKVYLLEVFYIFEREIFLVLFLFF